MSVLGVEGDRLPITDKRKKSASGTLRARTVAEGASFSRKSLNNLFERLKEISPTSSKEILGLLHEIEKRVRISAPEQLQMVKSALEIAKTILLTQETPSIDIINDEIRKIAALKPMLMHASFQHTVKDRLRSIKKVDSRLSCERAWGLEEKLAARAERTRALRQQRIHEFRHIHATHPPEPVRAEKNIRDENRSPESVDQVCTLLEKFGVNVEAIRGLKQDKHGVDFNEYVKELDKIWPYISRLDKNFLEQVKQSMEEIIARVFEKHGISLEKDFDVNVEKCRDLFNKIKAIDLFRNKVRNLKSPPELRCYLQGEIKLQDYQRLLKSISDEYGIDPPADFNTETMDKYVCALRDLSKLLDPEDPKGKIRLENRSRGQVIKIHDLLAPFEIDIPGYKKPKTVEEARENYSFQSRFRNLREMIPDIRDDLSIYDQVKEFLEKMMDTELKENGFAVSGTFEEKFSNHKEIQESKSRLEAFYKKAQTFTSLPQEILKLLGQVPTLANFRTLTTKMQEVLQGHPQTRLPMDYSQKSISACLETLSLENEAYKQIDQIVSLLAPFGIENLHEILPYIRADLDVLDQVKSFSESAVATALEEEGLSISGTPEDLSSGKHLKALHSHPAETDLDHQQSIHQEQVAAIKDVLDKLKQIDLFVQEAKTIPHLPQEYVDALKAPPTLSWYEQLCRRTVDSVEPVHQGRSNWVETGELLNALRILAAEADFDHQQSLLQEQISAINGGATEKEQREALSSVILAMRLLKKEKADSPISPAKRNAALEGLLQSLLDTVQKRLSQVDDSREKNAVAIDLLQFLTGFDPARQTRHLSNLFTFHLLQKDFYESVEILHRLILDLPIEFRAELTMLTQLPDAERLEIFHRKVMEALADIKIAQANRIFESIKPSLEGGDVAKTRLEPQELALIESVIFDAIGNRELSIKLYQKIPQSSLEKFLCILSYNTSRGEPTCGQAAKHVKIGLQTTGLESFLTQCKTYTQSKQKLKKLLEKLQTQQFSCFSREIRDISAILNEFTSASYQSQSQLQEFLDEKTKERFSRLGDAINELRKAAASQEEFLPSIHEPIVDDMPKIDETLATCTQSLQTICNMLKDFERSGLPSEDYHPPLHVSDLRTIFHYARLEESFAKFRLLGISFRDPKLLLLEKEVTEAHDLTHNLDSLIQLLPAYSSGDIFLDDEALISRFHGEEGPVFSQISLLRHPTSLKTLIKEGAARGPFAIQPYFTGSRTHAGMTILSGGVLSTFEITGRFISHPMTFEDACMNVAYRPDFLALLTPDGKRTLEQLWGELSQDEINRKLIELYTDTLRQYFALHEPQLRSLVNDCQKSTEAYFLDMTRSAPTALQHLVMSVSKRFFHWEKGGGLPWHLPPASLSFDENKMFCSEFVAKMFTQIQQTMKDYLNSQMPEDHLPVDFFQPVFPESVKKESIHPNRLEELLLPTFSRVKSPLALRLLLETSE